MRASSLRSSFCSWRMHHEARASHNSQLVPFDDPAIHAIAQAKVICIDDQVLNICHVDAK